MKETIVLYDGVCLFCEGWVNFVIDHLRDDVEIRFIPLQLIELNSSLFDGVSADALGDDTIICITDQGSVFFKSDASLNVMLLLISRYSFFAKLFLLIPKFIRNKVYDFIGERRLSIWGEKNVCELPTADRKHFFVSSKKELSQFKININYEKYFSFKQKS